MPILSNDKADYRYCDEAFGEEDSLRNVHQILRPASAISMRKIPAERGKYKPRQVITRNKGKR